MNKLISLTLLVGTVVTGGAATSYTRRNAAKPKKSTTNKLGAQTTNPPLSTISESAPTKESTNTPIQPPAPIQPTTIPLTPLQKSVIKTPAPEKTETPPAKKTVAFIRPKTRQQIFMEKMRIKWAREEKHSEFLRKLEEKLNHVSDTSLAEHKQSFSQALKSNKYPNVVYSLLGQNHIVTMKGVQPIKQSDITQHSSRGNIVRRKSTHKYFDINKNMDGNDDLLCAGITAANQIYFWLRKNETNILKYIKHLKGTPEALTDQQESDLMQLINWAKTGKGEELLLSKWIAERFGGGFADLDTIFGWFFWGSKFTTTLKLGFFRTMLNKIYNPIHYVPERRTSGVRQDLENFAPIYMRKIMPTRKHIDHYSKFLKEAFSKGVPMSFSWTDINGRSPHVTTAWQAEFDDQGNVQAIWISDSDDVWDDESTIGLRKMYFYSYHNKLMVSENAGEKGRGGRILTGMDYLNIEDNIFEQYFAI